MGVILLPQKHLTQPQYASRLDPWHWLTKDVTFALNGAVPYFNAAKGGSAGLSAGGSGFSVRTTPLGRALYTPDGGWADFAVGQDWAGPNTIIALCRINSMDTWGGLFSKDSSGTSTQFAVGQENNFNTLYGSVENGTATSFSGSSISTLANFSVIAFTHSGVTSTAKSYYRNGTLVGSTGALGAQNTGTGVLGLGRSRDSSGSFDSDVDWVGFIRVRRVLSATEIAEVSRNIWAVWKAPARRIWSSGVAAYTLTASSGAYAVTGTAASLKFGRLVSASSGSVAVTGTAATLKHGSAVSANSGSFAVTGTAASLLFKRVLSATSGSFAVTGTDATLTKATGGQFTLSADSGSFVVTGNASSLVCTRAVSASSGSVIVTGTAATLKASRMLLGGSGSFVVTGTDATLTLAANNHYSLTCDLGTFLVAGTAATLAKSGGEIEDFGGDDAPIIIRKRKKKTLREQPNKHLEHILNKAVEEFQGKVKPATLKLNRNKSLEVKEVVSVATLPNGSRPAPALGLSDKEALAPTALADAEKDAEKVAQLLAVYQQQVAAQDDEDLLMLLAEFF